MRTTVLFTLRQDLKWVKDSIYNQIVIRNTGMQKTLCLTQLLLFKMLSKDQFFIRVPVNILVWLKKRNASNSYQRVRWRNQIRYILGNKLSSLRFDSKETYNFLFSPLMAPRPAKPPLPGPALCLYSSHAVIYASTMCSKYSFNFLTDPNPLIFDVEFLAEKLVFIWSEKENRLKGWLSWQARRTGPAGLSAPWPPHS